MVIGKLYNSPVIIAAAVLAIMSFFDGHVGDFSRAAGVMLLILIEKIKIGEFTLKLVQLVRLLSILYERFCANVVYSSLIRSDLPSALALVVLSRPH